MPAVPSGSYDAIYSPGVVEHFEEGPQAILKESHRLLRPGGVLLLSTPCLNDFRKRLVRRGAFNRAASRDHLFYQYAFSDEEMRSILASCGFEVLSSSYRGSLKTLRDHTSLARIPLGRLGFPLALALDWCPLTRQWGHSCLWVARRAR